MKHLVVIGAGPAGLTAALELLRRAPEAYAVTVLEAQEQVGGISKTVVHNGNRMDLGGHRFFSKSSQVNQFWEELLPFQGAPAKDDADGSVPLSPNGPDPNLCDKVMLRRKRVSRIYYKKKFFDYPIRLKAKTLQQMGPITTLRAGTGYLFACIAKRKENSLEDFYINRFGKVLYRLFFESYTEKLWGRHPREISADWGAQRVKGLSLRALWKDLMSGKTVPSSQKETSLIEEFLYPKYGPGQLWEEAEKRICALGGKVLLGAEVTAVTTEGTRVTSVSYRRDGREQVLEADAVFSSMPLKDLVAALPQVPAEQRRIALGLPYRDFVTVGVLIHKEDLLCPDSAHTTLPDCWIYVQDRTVTMGRIQLFHNWSPYLLKEENTAWLGLEFFCQENDDFWTLSEESCTQLAIDELIRMGLVKEGARVLDSHRERVKKAYPAYFDTYEQMDSLRLYLNRFPNLYCIGRNGQHRYNNMDHSMLTAMKAVDLLLAGSRDKEELWQINAEKEYHEHALQQKP